jgi:hypothetical protein
VSLRRRYHLHAFTWLALLAQVHLCFVLELHHHEIDALVSGTPRPAGLQGVQMQALPAPTPPCPVCHVARQGSIPGASAIVTPLLAPAVGAAPTPTTPHYSLLAANNLATRDPPLS